MNTSLHILRTLSLTSDAVEGLYDLSFEVASFYKNNIHQYVIKAIAFFIAGCIHLYVNRNNIRNTIGSLFVYSYTPEPVEVEEQEEEPTPQVQEKEQIDWGIQFPSPQYVPNYSELMTMTARELRVLAGTRRRVAKAELIDMILAC